MTIEPDDRSQMLRDDDPGAWARAVLSDDTDEYGIPGTGVVWALIATVVCFGIGWVAFEVAMLLRKWFA